MSDGAVPRRLLLLDGNSLTYRAFFALPSDMATASGQVTNAVFGFTSMLVNLLRDHRPSAIAVAWDRPEPTFRHERVQTYKAQREEAPDILRQQLGLVRQVLSALRVPMLEAVGFEADDVIATLATRARDRGDEVIVVTGDRDSYQLVEDPLVKVLYNRRGVSDYVLYDEAGIAERTGVTPEQYPQYAALRGDPSDNLPGVPGVGEKTAAKLITTHGGLDGIFAAIDAQTPKLRANPGRVRGPGAAQRRGDGAGARRAPRRRPGRAGRGALRRRRGALAVQLPRVPHPVRPPGRGGGRDGGGGRRRGAAHRVRRRGGGHGRRGRAPARRAHGRRARPVAVAAAWAGVAGRSPLEGLALVVEDPGAPDGAGPDGVGAGGDGAGPQGPPARAAWLPAALLDDAAVAAALGRALGPAGRPLRTHDAKALLRSLAPYGVDVRTLDVDTAVAGYLLDPAEAQYLLEDLVLRYLGVELRSPEVVEGRLDLDGEAADLPATTATRAVAVGRLAPAVAAALDAQGLRRLHDEVERPLVRVLARMELVGVGVDVGWLRDLNDRLAVEARQLERGICEAAGEEFNVNSTLQLRRILFDQLGLTPQKKTKTGYSTDAASLEKLRGQHPVVELLLRYREVEKLRSTYGEGLAAEVGPDGRIHATFNQTVARTGRLSSDAPNLHNIPVRTDEGREFRRAFVPTPGFELLVADYNQIELRVIAHLAEDPGLIAAFEAREDIHRATAARIFHVEPGHVTVDQRSKAKMVSYGLAYGMEAFGLAQRLGIAVREASGILDAYFAAFPNVRAYMEATVAEARSRGYTETLMGRRRPIPELQAGNPRIRQAGERQAMNAGIQGLAADIFKVALVRLDQALEQRGLRSRLILQVHDEVIVEVVPEEHDEAAELTVDAMASACPLRVPLEVNLAFGTSWADAKG